MARLKQYRWKLSEPLEIQETGMILNNPTLIGKAANYDIERETATIILAAREEGSGHDTPLEIRHELDGGEEGLDTAAVSAIVRAVFPNCEETIIQAPEEDQ